ncbi:MAG TPA: hypothetical protein PK691_00480 [Thermomicrobiales bacterium]|nr:hypothetical protein [Thermomicrobiales bacterium]
MRDELLFILILLLRLGVPLGIPRFPLPAMAATMLLDALDQPIYRSVNGASIEAYQAFDKALDIYYLTIAYLSTMRNWDNRFAFEVSRVLFYFRLIGVVLFESTQQRSLLVIFPNTFEYFFIFIEVASLRWDIRRMSRRTIIGAAAGIWVLIKLPQEYWIHIARLDVTDTIGAHLMVLPVLAGIAIGAVAGVRWLLSNRLPEPEFAVAFDVDRTVHRSWVLRLLAQPVPPRPLVSNELWEKILMMSLVAIIFAQVLPEVKVTDWQVCVSVSLLVFANSAVNALRWRRLDGRTVPPRQLPALLLLNGSLGVMAYGLLPLGGGPMHMLNMVFFILLLTLLMTLYNRFRPAWLVRSQPSFAEVVGIPFATGRLST